MDKITVYSLRIDGRSKDIILSALSDLQSRIENAVSNGASDEGTLRAYDEVTQLRRGVALSPGEEIDMPQPEQPEQPEPTETPEEMYHSQDGRYSDV